MNKLSLLIFSLLAVAGAACSNDEPTPSVAPTQEGPMVNAEAPVSAAPQGMGVFTGYAHALQGKGLLLTETNGNQILRFENFTMTAGPDVYVFASRSNVYSRANVIAISKLEGGFTNSSLNFAIDNTINFSTHPSVTRSSATTYIISHTWKLISRSHPNCNSL